MPNSDSMVRVLQTARTRFLTFVPNSHPIQGTNTIAARLGTATGAGAAGKLYIDQAPDPGAYPYGIMRLTNSLTSGDDGGYQIRGVIELSFYSYRRETAPLMSSCMDIAEQAWRDWVALVTNDTIVAQRSYARASVPYEAPADRELVCERALFPFYATPQYKAGAA